MIEARELRIENLLEKNGAVIKVDVQVIQKILDIRSASGYKGIPLTPEWLEKLGFENRPVKWADGTTSKDLFISKDNLWFLHEYGHWNFFKKDRDEGSIILTTIHHVHQLQNLIFSLTGTELELK